MFTNAKQQQNNISVFVFTNNCEKCAKNSKQKLRFLKSAARTVSLVTRSHSPILVKYCISSLEL